MDPGNKFIDAHVSFICSLRKNTLRMHYLAGDWTTNKIL